ncbi:MAG: calcium/sodium antiporter [Pseudomonadota bacterium]
MHISLAFFMLFAAFMIMFKAAELFVKSTSNIATILNVPKMIAGIVLMGLATTAPEFAVSVQSAYMGHPEIALGNAVGSVICDDGIALGLAAVIAPVAIGVDKKILKVAAIFLIAIYALTYVFAFNGTFSRLEGLVLVASMAGYFYYIFLSERRKRRERMTMLIEQASELPLPVGKKDLVRNIMIFLVGLAGVLIASRVVIWSCLELAAFFKVPEVIVGLTVIAIGTSLPEISTCLIAARKGEGELAVGDIIGADILNILWIVGVSALVNPMQVATKVINFMFPWMFLIVGVMLICLRIRYRIGKPKGVILLALYVIYLVTTLIYFGPEGLSILGH